MKLHCCALKSQVCATSDGAPRWNGCGWPPGELISFHCAPAAKAFKWSTEEMVICATATGAEKMKIAARKRSVE
ncbi:MAG: hypothetical protein IPP94_13060 [Ignavibacteria bacterium]|nr:hypothetical protein [Ignavibacteria bacterium]